MRRIVRTAAAGRQTAYATIDGRTQPTPRAFAQPGGRHGPPGASLRLRRDVLREAVGLFETGGCRARGRVDDIVRPIESDTFGDAVKAGHAAHAVGYRVISTGRIAADTEAANHLAALIQREPAAKGDDAAGNEADPEAFLLENRIE